MHDSIPEYLDLFSDAGEVTIRVKFTDSADKGRSIREFNAQWNELKNLIDPDTKAPFSGMYFDSYFCQILKIEIKPARKLIVIHAGSTGIE